MSSPSNEAGYRSAAYIRALGHDPLPLGLTGGYLVRREIAGGGVDLAGAYPLFTCADWSALPNAIEGLPNGPVSLTLVTDPFQPLTPPELQAIFPICRKLHDHWIIDLAAPLAPSKHHRRALRLAGNPRIEAGPARPEFARDWAALYAGLVARKQITDARAFSAASLAVQLVVPGAHVVTAWDDDLLLGADLYYIDRGRAFAHLSAYAPEGYAQRVSYPMIAAACDYLRPLAHVLDLGGAPAGEAGLGIAHFKAGWTDLTRPTWLCGKVLDAAAYAALCPDAPVEGYFPAYRRGDFAG